MITKQAISLEMNGETFSPSEARLLTGLSFTRMNDPGGIGTRGRYKGMPVPYGMCALEVPADIPAAKRLTWLLDAALPHMGTLRRLGATEMYVSIGYFWRDQCNLAYSSEELTKLARLGIDLCVSCYEEEG